MNYLPVIFTHYGNSEYLKYSLLCLKYTNPNSRLILLGDVSNRKVAKKCGWEHYNLIDYSDSLHNKFNYIFKHVQGKKHNHIRYGQDWLKYVFERWFRINSFIQIHNISRFWHFDSDTMVLKDLSQFVEDLSRYDFSLQCNNTCLNGIVSSNVVLEFCQHICCLFEDEAFLEKQQKEFDTVSENYAFTEMRAFDHYQHLTPRNRIHLLTAFNGVVFDDCICQEHGFEMQTLPSGEIVKKISFKDGRVYGYLDEGIVEFSSLNLSWVPIYLFRWVLSGLINKDNKSLDSIRQPVRFRVIKFLKKFKKRSMVDE